ncbi:MAG: malonic semialdehyde reductase [Nevskiaceae bacterium]|nr:MAG: malonic semialdehyde reductase [Nevskiaceae bacterium]TBR71480.1 MAG: malonic semialdehyde reductase [Nevskiaceae bacterium]
MNLPLLDSGLLDTDRLSAEFQSVPAGRLHAVTKSALPTGSLDQLFRQARTYNEWSSREIDEWTIHGLYELLKWGPTAANSSPARFVWVKSAEGKARLSALAMDANRAKILAAPVTVIIGYDLAFAETMPELFPARGEMLREFYREPTAAADTAQRNSSLQGAYLIIAARALGLDCGPMSGFDNAGVDREFFAGTRIQSNFICSLGYGKPGTPFPRNPRLSFDEAGRWA